LYYSFGSIITDLSLTSTFDALVSTEPIWREDTSSSFVASPSTPPMLAVELTSRLVILKITCKPKANKDKASVKSSVKKNAKEGAKEDKADVKSSIKEDTEEGIEESAEESTKNKDYNPDKKASWCNNTKKILAAKNALSTSTSTRSRPRAKKAKEALDTITIFNSKEKKTISDPSASKKSKKHKGSPALSASPSGSCRYLEDANNQLAAEQLRGLLL